METVIYGDVLVAINFIINLMILGLTGKLTGIPVKPFRRYLGALAGALASFVIFLPVQGFWVDIFIRVGVTALVIGITYFGHSPRDMLRLSVVFFGVGFLFAGFTVGIWFLLPQELFSYAHGILYLDIAPLLLVVCIGAAYLFVTVFDRIFDSGGSREGVWHAVIARGDKKIELLLFMDTGNHLTEPFSGLPVMISSFEAATLLLTGSERGYIMGRPYDMPAGLRPVFYSGVGTQGLLYAIRPDSITLCKNGKAICCEGYLALSQQELSCHGCSGIFNPRLLGISLGSR